MPTHIRFEEGAFRVELPLEVTLNATQTTAFENATAEFIANDLTMESGDLTDAKVVVTRQTVVEVDEPNQNNRELMNFNDLKIQQHLVMELTASATYAGTDVDFNFTSVLNHELRGENPAWLRLLAQKDAIFDSIVPEEIKTPPDASSSKIQVQAPENGDSGVSKGGIAAASILSVFAMTVGVVAVVYSLKSVKESTYGRELESTGGSSSLKSASTSSGGRIARESIAMAEKQYEGTEDDDAMPWKTDSTATPLSPNSLEQGKSVAISQIMKPKPKLTQQTILRTSASVDSQGSGWDHIVSAASKGSNGSGRARDPPSSSHNVNATKPEARKMASLIDNNVSVADITFVAIENTEWLMIRMISLTNLLFTFG